jgi:hypothetical protein
MNSTRRDLLKLAMGTAAAFHLRMATAQQPSVKQASPVPKGSRSKFNADGSVRGFAGNTIISHLPAQGALRDATVALHDALLIAPFRARFAVLPTDSYHMTVFNGANDQDRVPATWPTDLPQEMPIEECTRIFDARLASFLLDRPMPIRMKLDQAITAGYTDACSLRLVPADDAENHAIRGLRDRLADLLHLHAPDHATYAFHITIAYRLSELSAADDRAYRNLLADHVARISAAAPVIELGLPEFCSFKNMHRYDVLRYLRTA